MLAVGRSHELQTPQMKSLHWTRLVHTVRACGGYQSFTTQEQRSRSAGTCQPDCQVRANDWFSVRIQHLNGNSGSPLFYIVDRPFRVESDELKSRTRIWGRSWLSVNQSGKNKRTGNHSSEQQ